MLYAVTIQGIAYPIRCRAIAPCPIKPQNLVLVDCEGDLAVAPHPNMRGSWSIPSDLIHSYVLGKDVPAPVLEVHGPTPEPPEITAAVAERARRAELQLLESSPRAETDAPDPETAPVKRRKPRLLRKPSEDAAPTG